MSEDDREIEVESEEDQEEEENRGRKRTKNSNQVFDKRAHHNALERKRRDHIKDSFTGLRDAIPVMAGDKSSRAQILKKASDYIIYMRNKTQNHHEDIDDLKKQNVHLEEQIRALERAKSAGNFASPEVVLANAGLKPTFPSGSSGDLSYESSGSDSSDGSGSSSSVIAVALPPSNSATYIQVPGQKRIIAPGQSLLIHNNDNPPKKKFKIQ